MKHTIWMIAGLMVITSGCQTVKTRSKMQASVVGSSIQSVIKAHAGHKITIFDKAGKPLENLPQQEKGSVSIYNKDRTGQDNYTFDKSGVIKKHLRSYGADFPPGKWKEVK